MPRYLGSPQPPPPQPLPTPPTPRRRRRRRRSSSSSLKSATCKDCISVPASLLPVCRSSKREAPVWKLEPHAHASGPLPDFACSFPRYLFVLSASGFVSLHCGTGRADTVLLYTGDHSPFAGPTERGPSGRAVKTLEFSDAPGAFLSCGCFLFTGPKRGNKT